MTLKAAAFLDEAFALYLKIATVEDGNRISCQTSYLTEPYKTPYDHAASLCRSLLPLVYNYPAEDQARTERIWDLMVDALEVLPIDVALSQSVT
jgi:hypothetical protein